MRRMSQKMDGKFQLNFQQTNRQTVKTFLSRIPTCDSMEVLQIPSSSKALELITSKWFQSDILALDSMMTVNLKIDRHFDGNFEKKLKSEKFSKKLSFVVVFASMDGKQRRICWKSLKNERLKILDDFEDREGTVTDYCLEFLAKELKNEDSAINVISPQQYFKVQDLSDASAANLLIVAAKENNNNKFQKLLDFGFHVDQQDSAGLAAIDHAWINYSSQSHAKASSADMILKLLKANSKFPSQKVQFAVKSAPLDVQKFVEMTEQVHTCLMTRNIQELDRILAAEPELHHFYDRNNKSLLAMAIESPQMDIISRISHRVTLGAHEFSPLENSHILVLKSKSKIKSAGRDPQSSWKSIDNAFDILEKSKTSSAILKITSAWTKLKIVFDFQHDLNFSHSIPSQNDVIYVGAKNLPDETATNCLLRELTLLALRITFANDYNAYSSGESKTKKRFTEKVTKEWTPKSMSHVELTCAAVQLKNLHNHPETAAYLDEVVVPKMLEAMPVLKMLQNEEQLVSFKDLTKSMKERVLRSDVTFQGYSTSFYDIFGSRVPLDILSLLTSENLKDCLVRKKAIKISEVKLNALKAELSRRKFATLKPENEDVKNFMEVRQHAGISGLFLYAEYYSQVRKAVFEGCAGRLNKLSKNFWVCYFHGGDFADIPEGTDSCDFMLKTVKAVSEIEAKIFQEMLKIGKVIIFIDGIDDLGTKSLQFLKSLRKKTKNQIWMSCHPQNAPKFEEFFKIDAFKSIIVAYDKEKRKFIAEVLKNKEHEEILAVIHKMEVELDGLCTIENHLIIKLVAELHATKKIAAGLFRMFEKITEKNAENFKNPALLNVHQVFGIKSIFGNKFDEILGFKVADLEVLRKHEEQKHRWTSAEVIEFGFLAINADGSFDFVHRSLAEFFAAKFVVVNFFGATSGTSDAELEKVLKLLLIIKNGGENFEMARVFLVNFVRNELKSWKLSFRVKKLVLKEAFGILRTNKKLRLGSLEFWTACLHSDAENLKILWQVGEKQGLMTKFLISDALTGPDDFWKLLELKYESKSREENFVKLLEENVEVEDEKIIFEKLFEFKAFKFADSEILLEILPKICDIFGKSEIKIVKFFKLSVANEKILRHFGKNLEDILGNNPESIRNFLFHDYSSATHPLINAIKSESLETFKLYKNLYEKYQTNWNELQDIVIAHSVIFEAISFVNPEIFPDFEKFLMEVFESNKDRMRCYIRNFFGCGTRIFVRKNAMNYVTEIMKCVLTGAELKKLNIETKIKTFSDFVL